MHQILGWSPPPGRIKGGFDLAHHEMLSRRIRQQRGDGESRRFWDRRGRGIESEPPSVRR